MVRLFSSKNMSTWRDPYRVMVVNERHEGGQIVLTMQARIRYWHPCLWWMIVRTIVRGEV